MTKSGFDIDELERLLAAATPGEEWFIVRYGDGDSLVICLDEAGNQRVAFMAVPGGRDHATRKRAWKEIKANAALIVAARNSLPAILTEIRELRAENARLLEDVRRQTSLAQDHFRNATRLAARAALGEPQ